MRTFVLVFFGLALAAAPRTPARLAIVPANPLMFGRDSRQNLLAIAHYADGSTEDVTAAARFQSTKPAVAVEPGPSLRALANGGATIVASYAGLTATTTALIQSADQPVPSGFAADVVPILTKYGCNSGACHGSLNGQNGFKLSLFGYEPAADHEMIVRKHDGRRVNLNDPATSLLLAKPSFDVTHGGGKLLRKDSEDYASLLAWLRGGATFGDAFDRRMVALRVTPQSVMLYGKEAKARLLVTARYSDGTEADVTRLVRFTSNDDSIAAVSATGQLTAVRGGETAVTVRGPGLTAAARIGVVTERRKVAPIEPLNFIDEHISAKQQRLEIAPSEPCDDATFLRRAYLDIIGLIPTAEEARRFLGDKDPGKRAKLVDHLLTRPEYADYWALYWGDHLSNTRQLLYNKGPYTFTRWLHDQFRANVPFDQFARRLLVSSGNMYDAPATSYYPLMKKELDMAAVTSQLFLGVTIDCARCHNHPLEKWTQSDFSGMAAFFSQVRYKGAGPRNNERILYVDFERQFVHPETKQSQLPKPLDGPEIVAQGVADRRELLANWMTSPSNPFFAKAIVNRMWRNFMGRGFVEPVDDFRVTNPPSNEPLLDALAQDFIRHNFDLHHLIRRITSARAYQLSSAPSDGNRDDTMAYSRYYVRRLSAEPLADSIALATGVPDTFKSLYPGTRAAQVPDPEIESYFLEVFDRPSRQNVCERKNTPTLNQTMHLIAGETVHNKLTNRQGRLAAMIASGKPQEAIVEDLYLSTLARFPDLPERQLAAEAIRRSGSAERGLQDIFWALLNSKEFLYNH